MGFFKKLLKGAGKVLKKVAAPAATIAVNAISGGLASRALTLSKSLGMRLSGGHHDTMSTADQAALVRQNGGKAAPKKKAKSRAKSVLSSMPDDYHDVPPVSVRNVISRTVSRAKKLKVPKELAVAPVKVKKPASPAQLAARAKFAAAARARAGR